MKKLFLVTACLLVISALSAQQSQNPDERLSVRYSPEEIQNLSVHAPEQIELLNFQLEKGYEIVDMPISKIVEMPDLYYYNAETKSRGEKVDCLQNIDDFNIFEYDFERKYSKNTYYKIGESNHVLVIYSNKKFVKLYNNR